MSQRIVGWNGVCFIPGEGKREDNGEIRVMTMHGEDMKPTPEEAWEDAKKLGEKHFSNWIAVLPATEDHAHLSKARKLVTFAVYTTKEVPD